MPAAQPLILVDEVAPLGGGGRPPGATTVPRAGGTNRRSRWRSATVWSAVLVVALIAVAQPRGPRPEPSPAAGGAAGPGWTTGEPTDASGLVVRVIPPNEGVAVFSHPDHRFCGDLELRLDGSPVPIRMLVETDAGLLVTFEAPAQAAAGPRAAELISGTPAPKTMGACRESVRHRRTIAVATADV